MRALLVVAVLLLAGCSDAPDGERPAADGMETGDPQPTAALPPPMPPAPRVLNLTGAQRLVTEPAGVGKVTLNMGPVDMFTGSNTPTLVLGPSWEHDLQITGVRVEGHVSTDVPTASAQIMSEVAFWLGVDEEFSGFVFAAGPDVLAPGQVAPVDAAFELDAGGIVVPAGSSLILALGTLYVDDGSFRHTHLLTGPEQGTTFFLEAQWVDLPEADAMTELLSSSAEVAGSSCAPASTGTEATSIPFEVPPGMVHMQADLVVTESTGTGNDDIDVSLFDSAGQRVGHTTAPWGTETLRLWAPHLEGAAPGEWTAVVTTCAAQRVTFSLTVAAAPAA